MPKATEFLAAILARTWLNPESVCLVLFFPEVISIERRTSKTGIIELREIKVFEGVGRVKQEEIGGR